MDGFLDTPCFKCGADVGMNCGCKPRGIELGYLDRLTRDRYLKGIEKCESPIETRLLGALQIQSYDRGFDFLIETERPSEVRYGKSEIVCVPQLEVGSYRPDFTIFDLKRSSPECIYALIVECDGHDFHDRTKEQAAKDRFRDRELTFHGFTIFRFTGSEIHKDALHWADQVLAYLERGIS
jgi:very-short-patch-repair endonuclease